MPQAERSQLVRPSMWPAPAAPGSGTGRAAARKATQAVLLALSRRTRSKQFHSAIPGRAQMPRLSQPARPSQQASAFKPSIKTLLAFERAGHATLRHSVDRQQVKLLRQTIQPLIERRELAALKHRVRVLVSEKAAAACTSRAEALATLRKHDQIPGFLQWFNLHR